MKSKKKIINMVADWIYVSFSMVYKAYLSLYIIELLVFACFVIGEYEGVISPKPYANNMYEIFSNNRVQLYILLIVWIGGIFYLMYKSNIEEFFIYNFFFFAFALLVNADMLNIISTSELKKFVIYSILTLVVVFMAKKIRNRTYEGYGRSIMKL